jgi:hypothetical protein
MVGGPRLPLSEVEPSGVGQARTDQRAVDVRAGLPDDSQVSFRLVEHVAQFLQVADAEFAKLGDDIVLRESADAELVPAELPVVDEHADPVVDRLRDPPVAAPVRHNRVRGEEGHQRDGADDERLPLRERRSHRHRAGLVHRQSRLRQLPREPGE